MVDRRSPKFGFRSFRTRLLVFLLGLLILVLVTAFLAVNTASRKNARAQIDSALEITAGVFHRLTEARNRRLLEAARLLSSDFAFKQAYAADDHPTLLSALGNHQARIRADLMVLVSPDGDVLADTLHPQTKGVTFAHPQLIDAAMDNEYGEHAAVIPVDGHYYQVAVVPLLVPTPDAFIIIGFQIGDALTRELRTLTLTEISLTVKRNPGGWRAFASTLPKGQWNELDSNLKSVSWAPGKSGKFSIAGNDYVSLVAPVASKDRPGVWFVLQRSLDDALAPYRRLQHMLVVLFGLALLLSIAGGIQIARSVTRPVLQLAGGAHRIENGNYNDPVTVTQRDELGELAESFNRMGKGLAERDKVRSLLGKVVSPAIAEKLLSRKIELGGEECEVTILFSDLRGFTKLCEDYPPKEVVALLNAHLTRQTEAIESNGGVVNQYLGDAVMALFGAPLRHDDDPSRAVTAAMDMHKTLDVLNAELAQQGRRRHQIGVGINTASVIAGNMGSLSRLTYTVIGDGVNLAARLESLTKFYQTPIIINQSTRNRLNGFVCRELDRVCVKGKTEPCVIYAPVGRTGNIEPALMDELRQYQQALDEYRSRHWDDAETRFRNLRESAPCRLYEIYLERIEQWRTTPPGGDWSGTHVFDYK